MRHEIDLGSLGKHLMHNKDHYHYGLVTLGNTLWATDWLGLNINANGAFGDLAFAYFGAGIVVVF
jgi:hypothetical protein